MDGAKVWDVRGRTLPSAKTNSSRWAWRFTATMTRSTGDTDYCGNNFGSIHESSIHESMMMAVFCDGSAHAIAYDIDPTDIWRNLPHQ